MTWYVDDKTIMIKMDIGKVEPRVGNNTTWRDMMRISQSASV